MRVLRTGLKLATLRPKIIVPGGGGAIYRGNEPAGFTRITERSFDSLDEDGWGVITTDGAEIASDPTAPHSPNNVLQFNYPGGMEDGGAPESTSLDIDDWKHVYLCFYQKYSANWFGHSTEINKMGYVWQEVNNPSFVYESQGAGTAPLKMRFGLQPTEVIVNPNSDGWYGTNLVPGAEIFRALWQMIEILLTGNSPGNTDGVLDAWLDGVHVMHWTGFQFSTGVTQWSRIRLDPVYGGDEPGETVPAGNDQTWSVDHYYASGKN